MTEHAEVRDRLLKEDHGFQRLARKHQDYDVRLQTLQSRRYLSDDEKMEEVNLKKLKLAIKDQMEAILRSTVAS